MKTYKKVFNNGIETYLINFEGHNFRVNRHISRITETLSYSVDACPDCLYSLNQYIPDFWYRFYEIGIVQVLSDNGFIELEPTELEIKIYQDSK